MHKYKKHITELGSEHHAIIPEEIIAELLLKKFSGHEYVLIAVGGPGGIGKSSFCKRLAQHLPDSNILRLDDYKTPREIRKGQNLFGAHPEANMMDLVKEHYITAKNGESFDKPLYNATSGEADETEFYETRRFSIIDGEISTYKQFRDYVDFSIFIDSNLHTQLNTRLNRDMKERQYTYEKAINTFLHSNLREFGEFGAESKNWADIHLHCYENYELIFESIAEENVELFQDLTGKEFTICNENLIPLYVEFKGTNKVNHQAVVNHLECLSEKGMELTTSTLQQALLEIEKV
jgi:uridine kinase